MPLERIIGGRGRFPRISAFIRGLLDDADAATALATLTARGQGKETIWIPAAAMWPRNTNGPSSVTRELTTGGGARFESTHAPAANPNASAQASRTDLRTRRDYDPSLRV